jgi:flagellar hook-associated protein 3 FlgL
MRISSSMVYNVNVANLNNQQGGQIKTQQQLSTGNRVMSPSDDPVASARALETKMAVASNEVHSSNQGTALDNLKYLDSLLGSVTEALQYVRDRTIQAGNGGLADPDKQTLASDVESQFENLLSIANLQDANGDYLFSGYKGNTLPFTGNLANVTYEGDQGERSILVSNSRQVPVSINGHELFMNIPSSNTTFSTHTSSATAVISDGTVSGPAAYTGTQYGIKFTSPTSYDVYDIGADPSMSSSTSPPLLASGVSYISGQTITLPDPNNSATAQISVSIAGDPSVGDTFTAKPGNSSDIFTTFRELIVGLKSTKGPAYEQMLTDTIGRLDSALENVSRLQANVGSREIEVDALTKMSSEANIQYTARIDRLVGLDYAATISTFQQQQTTLDAARNSFSKIAGLSLFKFIS